MRSYESASRGRVGATVRGRIGERLSGGGGGRDPENDEARGGADGVEERLGGVDLRRARGEELIQIAAVR